MKRFTLVMWVVSLLLPIVMLGLYGSGFGILVGARPQRLILQPNGIAVPDTGSPEAGRAPSVTVTLCRYWEGFRVRTLLAPRRGQPCPLIHGAS